jgi:hypothetical protein
MDCSGNTVEHCQTISFAGSSVTPAIAVETTTTTVADSKESILTVYPNPVVDQLNVVVDQSSIGTEYTITDMSGKILIKDQIPSQEFKIDMSGLSGGVYKIEIGGSVKLIKK